MNKEISIKEVRNGYQYTIKGSIKTDGDYNCMNTQEFKMLEHLGEVLLGFKIKVERR